MAASSRGEAQPIQYVYRGSGARSERELPFEGPDLASPHEPSIADLVPATEIMSRTMTCARRDLTTDKVVDLMVRDRIGCLPVVEESGRPIGVITKLDLVEQLLAGHDRPATANELMMPLALTLGEHATIAHAAALMAVEDVHHVPIVDDTGVMIGVVSSIDIVRWLARNDGYLR